MRDDKIALICVIAKYARPWQEESTQSCRNFASSRIFLSVFVSRLSIQQHCVRAWAVLSDIREREKTGI